jgi:hypothetical protein
MHQQVIIPCFVNHSVDDHPTLKLKRQTLKWTNYGLYQDTRRRRSSYSLCLATNDIKIRFLKPGYYHPVHLHTTSHMHNKKMPYHHKLSSNMPYDHKLNAKMPQHNKLISKTSHYVSFAARCHNTNHKRYIKLCCRYYENSYIFISLHKPFQSTVVITCTTHINSSAFFPQNVVTYFVWLSEQRVIISLNNSQPLALVIELYRKNQLSLCTVCCIFSDNQILSLYRHHH